MAVTTVTLTLGGVDKDMSVDDVHEVIQAALDHCEREGKQPRLVIGNGGGAMVLEIDPDHLHVSRLGRES